MARKASYLLLLVLTLVSIVVGCAQPAASPTSTTPASTVSAQALTDLYNAAKPEGEVLWQTVAIQTSWIQPIIDAFQKKYPGIKVTPAQIPSRQIVTQIITEAAAGKVSVDLAWSPVTYVLPLFDRDLLVRGDIDKLINVEPDQLLFDGRFYHWYDGTPFWIYNTKLVTAADAPKSFQDLLNPKWKGKMIVSQTALFAGALTRDWQKDKAATLDYLNKFAQQQPLLGATGGDTAQRVVSGEVPVGWTQSASVYNFLSQGAPIGICPISPLMAPPDGVFIPKNSPHPNAARLFVSFILSAEAKPLWMQTSFTKWNEGPVGAMLKAAGIQYSALSSAKDINDANDVIAAGVKALTPATQAPTATK